MPLSDLVLRIPKSAPSWWTLCLQAEPVFFSWSHSDPKSKPRHCWQADRIILSCGGCSVHCRQVAASLACTHQILVASISQLWAKTVSTHCQVSSRAEKSFSGKNHWSNLSHYYDKMEMIRWPSVTWENTMWGSLYLYTPELADIILLSFQTGVSSKVLKIHWPTGFKSLIWTLLVVWPLDGTWTSLWCNSLMKTRRKTLPTSYVIGSLQKLSELIMQIDWFLGIINCTISVSNIKNWTIIITIMIFVSHICLLCVHSVMSNSLQLHRL